MSADGTYLVKIFPKPRVQSRQKRRAEAGAFNNSRAIKLSTEDVGLNLHEQVVVRGAAIDVQLVNSHA